MKKRIISLILVLATVFLTLTGCAFNYAKSDMSKYASFSSADFKKLLESLVIEDADFSTDEATRQLKVTDAIAKALAGITDSEDKKFAGKVEKFDILYYCYYATDANGNVFFADKMSEATDASKLLSIQLGLTELDKEDNELLKLIADKLADISDISSYIYTTSNSAVVSEGDVVSISYTYEETVNGEKKPENNKVVFNEYLANDGSDLYKSLEGQPVGVILSPVTVTKTTEAGEVISMTYSNLKVEHIAVDSDSAKPELKDKDNVYVTYTVKFDADKIKGEDGKLPEGFKEANIDKDGQYKLTVKYEYNTLNADVKGEDGKVADADKTFLGQLIGEKVGTKVSSDITTKNASIKVNGQTVNVGEATYSDVTVNWVVKTGNDNQGFTVEYTPYAEDKIESSTTTKIASTYSNNETVELKNVKLTYHIFPLYFVDVEDAENVKLDTLLREFASTFAAEGAHHDDEETTDGEHNHGYAFESLNKDKDGNEFKNSEKNKTLAELVEELVDLLTKIEEKEATLEEKLEALKKAQTAYGKLGSDSDSATDKNNAETTLKNAEKDYNTARIALDLVKDGVVEDGVVKTAGVDHLVSYILACKKGETTVEAALLADFRQYNYDSLKNTYYDAISKSIASEILSFLKNNVTINDDALPKRAVKDAYKSLINEYKFEFYTGSYSSSVSNYNQYKGNFDSFLMAETGKNTIDEAEAKVMADARLTVKEIMLIYVLVDMVKAEFTDVNTDEFVITKQEKKELKKYVRLFNSTYEDYFEYYAQMGLKDYLHVLDFDTEYNAMQFNKVMEFLLEREDEAKDENGKLDTSKLKLLFKNLSYDFKEPATK